MPLHCLASPLGNLVKVGAIGKLVGAAIKLVPNLRNLWKVGRAERRILQPRALQRLSMVAAREALAACEPLAVAHGAVLEEVVDIFL